MGHTAWCGPFAYVAAVAWSRSLWVEKFAERQRAYCRASSAALTKLAFLRNAFVQFAGMFNVIFKFAVALA